MFVFVLKEIDEYINQAKEKGCSAVLQLGSKGVNYATNVIMQTALKVSEVCGGGRVSVLFVCLSHILCD